SFSVSVGCATLGLFRRLAPGGWRQVYTRAAGLRKADGNRLFCGPRSKLSLANVLHFFAHKFAGLRGGSFALALITPGPFEGLLFGHRFFSLNGSRRRVLPA